MHGVSRTSSRRKRILIAFIILHKHNVLLLSWVHTNTRKVFTDSKDVLLLSVWPPAASYCSASDTWTVGYHYIEQPCKDLHSYMFHMIRHIWGRWMIGERLDVLYYHKHQPLTICVRGLHGLKTEARTRPVPEIVWPNPTRAAQLNLEPEPDLKSPPTQRIAN